MFALIINNTIIFFLYQCRAAFFSPIDTLLGGLEWEVESTTVTRSSADW